MSVKSCIVVRKGAMSSNICTVRLQCHLCWLATSSSVARLASGWLYNSCQSPLLRQQAGWYSRATRRWFRNGAEAVQCPVLALLPRSLVKHSPLLAAKEAPLTPEKVQIGRGSTTESTVRRLTVLGTVLTSGIVKSREKKIIVIATRRSVQFVV